MQYLVRGETAKAALHEHCSPTVRVRWAPFVHIVYFECGAYECQAGLQRAIAEEG